MRPGEVIPDTRTFAPYSLTDAVGELTANTAGTDTAALSQSLDTLSATIDQIAPHLGPTFDGLTRVSEALNERNTVAGPPAEERRRGDLDPGRPQPAAQHSHSRCKRSGRSALATALGDHGTAGPHVGGGQGNVGIGPRQRTGTRTDSRPAQLGGRGARAQPRQHRQGAARTGEIPGDPRRDGGQRPVSTAPTSPISTWRRPCSRSSTTPSASGVAPTPVNRPTTPGPGPNCPSPTTGFPRGRTDAPATEWWPRSRSPCLVCSGSGRFDRPPARSSAPRTSPRFRHRDVHLPG